MFSSPLIQESDGSFYGTSGIGGAAGKGTVFRVTPSGTITTLHSFAEFDGSFPNGLVKGSDGNFYGTTGGGIGGNGTVFKMTPSGALSTIHFFTGNDGAGPRGNLVVGPDGNFYGTTAGSGPYPRGTVFKVSSSGALTTLYSFPGPDAWSPNGALALGTDGNLYGTTIWGGTAGAGAIFRITPSGVLTTLHSFSGIDGAYPVAGLALGRDGLFYGTTAIGGDSNLGTVFTITLSGVLSTLHSFFWSDGANPGGRLVEGSDGNFYGTARYGGSGGSGTVFRITQSGSFTSLFSFPPYVFPPYAAYPNGGLIEGTDGSFYGATSTDGYDNDNETIFRITPAGSLTTLYSSKGKWGGRNPGAGLVQGSGGNFLGTTPNGGATLFGTIFTVSPFGNLSTLYSFSGSDGSAPHSSLIQGADGNFYGMTSGGGASDGGTAFMITPSASLTTLHSFSGPDGLWPNAALIQRSDGNFYGTSTRGGLNGYGTVFKMTSSGVLSTLHSFSGGDGAFPRTALTQGSDGNFYGTTSDDAFLGSGSKVYKITPAGTLTVLYSFPSGGYGPQSNPSGLVEWTDGSFYGSISWQPSSPYGAVFKITKTGTLTTLHSLTASEGQGPGGLLLASDGNFYGTTAGGGANGAGTVFRITPSGNLTLLHSFTGDHGRNPAGTLVEGLDGHLYGVTANGGPGDSGVVFKLIPSGPLTPTATVSGGETICLGSPTTIQATLTGTPPWNLTWSDGVTQTAIASSPATRVFSPALSAIYTLRSISDANGSGLPSGSATVTVVLPLSTVTISPAGSLTVCSAVSDGSASAVHFGGGEVAYQWGYRLTSGGAVTPIPGQTSSAYYVSISDFPGAGTYHLVVTATPSCGSPMVSNELAISVNLALPTPFITGPATVGANSPNRTASVPGQVGSTYTWTIGNGSITFGQSSRHITFTAGTAGTPLTLSVTASNASGCLSSSANATVTVAPAGSAVLFYTVSPCRLLDTRFSTPIEPGETRIIPLWGGWCWIPFEATSVSANLAVTEPTADGYLTIYPADAVQPLASTLDFTAGQTRANNAIQRLAADGSGAIKVFNGSLGTTHVIIDVNGYFQ
jgi:uncharacterized repeat protein (TIGR03803 family)